MTALLVVGALAFGAMLLAIALVHGGTRGDELDREEAEHRKALRRLEKQWNDDHGGAA